MRRLEALLPTFAVVYLLWPHPRPFVIQLLPILATLVLILHLAVEGYRWQMIPIYLLTPLLVLSSLMKLSGYTDWPAIASDITVLALIPCIALPILLPIPKIPQPRGPYKVGTHNFMLKDISRKEIYSEKDEPRRMMIQIWYPAEPKATDKFAPWMQDANIYSIHSSRFLSLPDFFLGHLQLLKTPAYLAAPVAQSEEKFPIILFSHGWMGFRAQNTGQAVLLASHGYVVIGMEHPYGSMVTVFPDGSIAANNPLAMPYNYEKDDFEEVIRKLVKQWTEDMSFTLDQLQDPKSEAGVLTPHLDFSRIGVYGHSTGGGAAIQFSATDKRCKAILGLDPFVRPVAENVIEQGIKQPAFFIFSEQWSSDRTARNSQLFFNLYEHSEQPKGAIWISGTKHFDLSDIPLLSPIAPMLGIKGPLSGKRVTEIVDSYILAFFELSLKEKPSRFFDEISNHFAEVNTINTGVI
ncbi:MAG: dienelactone hydrolase family protein [Anaerolineales bacterium]